MLWCKTAPLSITRSDVVYASEWKYSYVRTGQARSEAGAEGGWHKGQRRGGQRGLSSSLGWGGARVLPPFSILCPWLAPRIGTLVTWELTLAPSEESIMNLVRKCGLWAINVTWELVVNTEFQIPQALLNSSLSKRVSRWLTWNHKLKCKKFWCGNEKCKLIWSQIPILLQAV